MVNHMQSDKRVLAVDGGNTKTVALVAALDGTILGASRGGCGDIYNGVTDEEGWPVGTIATIEQTVIKALQEAGSEPSDLVSGVFNMAGADWPEDFALLEDAMQQRGFGETILVQNDALGVLHAGTLGNVGVSVVCGTGIATGARGADGRVWHSSFWQLDAAGSGDLSHKMLTAIYRSELGLDLPTSLKERVLDYFALPSVEAVLHMFMRRRGRVSLSSHIASLTPILLDEAEAGDEVARRIVREHGQALGDYAIVAARKVGIEGTAFSLILAGGVLRHPSTLLSDALIERVRTTSPDVCPTRSRFEPVVGVLFTALEIAGVTIDDALLTRLVATMPTSELFETAIRRFS
jgi:N-acetylglucosamine kinase-like BadF-type ATPase